MSETQPGNALANLLDGYHDRFIGYVISSTFEDATVLTTDRFKADAGGLPATCLLLASAYGAEGIGSAEPADQQVLLFRVIGPKELPLDLERSRTLIENFKRKTEVSRDESKDGIDAITHSMLQWHGVECAILGTFFEDHKGNLRFGVDIEDFHVTSGLSVFKPRASVLERIVNHVDPDRVASALKDAQKAGFPGLIPPMEIARIRYTSTNRLARRLGDAEVPVRISPLDFIPRRTAIFGMTRTGKSNTVKTIISMAQLAACESKIPIGQLIFDLNGEYANANGQDDGSSIAEVFDDNVVRYRGIDTPGFKDLRDNFYTSLVDGLGFAQALVRAAIGATVIGQDMASFVELDLTPPTGDPNEKHHWERRCAIYKAILKKGRLDPGPNPEPIKFTFGREAAKDFGVLWLEMTNQVTRTRDEAADLFVKEFGDPKAGLDLDQTKRFFETIRKLELRNRENEKFNLEQAKKKEDNRQAMKPTFDSPIWLAPEETGLCNLLAAENSNGGSIRGFRFIGDTIRNYHSPAGNESIAEEIYSELEKGRIVILDLSVGVETVRVKRAETIAHKILEQSFGRFTNGGGAPVPKIVLYVEEAHNLIGKECSPDDTWPRIAKEGAKAGIALVYATQEPSAIHPFIRANTENVFTSHLNNDDEIRSIGRYYDFSDFGRSIKRSQDVGFARIKTLSSAFVLPVQIRKFEPDEIKKLYKEGGRPKDFKPVKPKPLTLAESFDELESSMAAARVPGAARRTRPAPLAEV